MSHSTTVRPAERNFAAVLRVPGDKSLSHRALIFSAFAAGRSRVRGRGTGQDVTSTVDVLGRLGVHVDGETVSSPGVAGWAVPAEPLDCGNSGTTLRLMTGALAGRPFRSTLTGDASLLRRPMRRLVTPLAALGATVTLAHGDTAPVTVEGGELHGADVWLDLASAQVRSAFALAAIQADGDSTLSGPGGYRDHTERWLTALGLGEWVEGAGFTIHPGDIPPHDYEVPGDPSSAAFLWASAAVRRGAMVTTPDVSLNPGRIGFLQILETMGARVEGEVTGEILGDPVGTITVTGEGLFGTEVAGDLAVAALDELPLVAVVAAYAEGITTVRNAAELRAKESDRVATTVAMIRALNGGAEPLEDGFVVLGTGWLDGGTVEAAGDHRIAMAAAVAATAATGSVSIDGAEAVSVSWPGFFETLEQLWSSR